MKEIKQLYIFCNCIKLNCAPIINYSYRENDGVLHYIKNCFREVDKFWFTNIKLNYIIF